LGLCSGLAIWTAEPTLSSADPLLVSEKMSEHVSRWITHCM
jgi:hypothetical protein